MARNGWLLREKKSDCVKEKNTTEIEILNKKFFWMAPLSIPFCKGSKRYNFFFPSGWFKTNHDKPENKTIAIILEEIKPQPKLPSTNLKSTKRPVAPATYPRKPNQELVSRPEKVVKMVPSNSRPVSRQALKPSLPLAQASKIMLNAYIYLKSLLNNADICILQ